MSAASTASCSQDAQAWPPQPLKAQSTAPSSPAGPTTNVGPLSRTHASLIGRSTTVTSPLFPTAVSAESPSPGAVTSTTGSYGEMVAATCAQARRASASPGEPSGPKVWLAGGKAIQVRRWASHSAGIRHRGASLIRPFWQPARESIGAMLTLTSFGAPSSPARVDEPRRPPYRIGAVQHRWHSDPDEHLAVLREGAATAASLGAQLVCFQELTLSRYFADQEPDDAEGAPSRLAESIDDGPTRRFATQLAADLGVPVHISLYEAEDGPDGAEDGLGYNTAIVVVPDGTLAARTRKLHIPVTAGYYEDRYFRQGPATGDSYPVVGLEQGRFGFPTCWDQWFPELARSYSLAGAEVLVYPTAIGSEPDHPGFDTEPLWHQVIVGNGIANGTFMVAVNRIGTEGELTFYGSSFISDPYGRVLVQAPRDEPAVLVADLDLDQRADWLALFPFLTTRRPDAYDSLTRQQ